MPRIPQYETQPTQLRPMSTPQMPLNDPVADQMVKAGEKLTAATSDIVSYLRVKEREQQKADLDAVAQFKVDLDGYANNLLYNPNGGLVTQKGTSAFGGKDALGNEIKGSMDTVIPSFDKQAQERFASLTERQQAVAKMYLQQERQNVEKEVLRHVTSEKNKAYEESIKIFRESAINNVGTYYSDPVRVAQEEKNGIDNIVADAKIKGESDQIVKYKIEMWRSAVHGTVIEKYIENNNAIAGQEYYKANDKMIVDAKVRSAIEHKLKVTVADQIGMTVADDYSQFKSAYTSNELYEQMKKDERLKNNPAAMKVAQSQFNANESQYRQGKNDALRLVAEPVDRISAEYLLKNNTPISPKVLMATPEYKALLKENPDEAKKRADEARRDWEHRIQFNQAQAAHARNLDTKERTKTYVDLKTNPSVLMGTNLDALFTKGQLTAQQYTDLATDRASIKANGAKAAQLQTNHQLIDGWLNKAHITQKNNADDYNEIYRRIQEVVNTLPPEQINQSAISNIAKNIVETKVSQSGSFFNKPLYKADPAKVEVPEWFRDEYSKRMKARGGTPTSSMTGQAWINYRAAGGSPTGRK